VRADLLAPDAGQPAERPPAAATEREPPTAEGIERAIRESATVAAAAMALGIHRSHLYRLMRQHGIDARARRGEGRSPATRGS
jgi:transcriptional regulator of acetoin/glycerol metabolism